jgi:hypothetical protein
MANKKVNSAASTNSTLLQAGASTALRVALTNNTAATKYLKLYDKATAPVVGTDVPLCTLGIPPNAALNVQDLRLCGALGLGYGITGAAADNDTTVTAVNDVTGLIQYK